MFWWSIPKWEVQLFFWKKKKCPTACPEHLVTQEEYCISYASPKSILNIPFGSATEQLHTVSKEVSPMFLAFATLVATSWTGQVRCKRLPVGSDGNKTYWNKQVVLINNLETLWNPFLGNENSTFQILLSDWFVHGKCSIGSSRNTSCCSASVSKVERMSYRKWKSQRKEAPWGQGAGGLGRAMII